MFYVLRTGCQWRDLPGGFPHWNMVYGYFAKWRDDGTWQRLVDALRQVARPAGFEVIEFAPDGVAEPGHDLVGAAVAHLEKRLARQLPQQEKALRATYVVTNDGDVAVRPEHNMMST